MTTTDHYWSSYYSRGKDFRPITASALTRLLSFVDDAAPRTNLDIGCGTGQLTRELYHRGYSCFGVDVSAKAIEVARSLTVRDELEYRHGDIEADIINNALRQAYGLITCKFVYAFIKDKTRFLASIAQLLVDRGSFVIMTPLVGDVPSDKKP